MASAPRYELQPLQGAGPIRLGMSRDALLEVLAEDPGVGPEPRNAELPPTQVPDRFHGGALRVHYEGDRERVVFIEFEPEGAAIEVSLFGKDVFTTPAAELLGFLDARSPYDRDDPELGVSFAFLDWELTLWRPVDPDAPPPEPDEDEDLEDDPVDPAQALHFARLGLGVRGYVSGELD